MLSYRLNGAHYTYGRREPPVPQGRRRIGTLEEAYEAALVVAS